MFVYECDTDIFTHIENGGVHWIFLLGSKLITNKVIRLKITYINFLLRLTH